MIILTGGAGFIGSYMAYALNQQDQDDLLIVDWLGSEEKWQNLVKRKIDHVLAPDQLPNWLQERGGEVTAVIHMGACSSTDELDGDFLMSNNVQYSMMLFRFCAEKKIPFLYASSAATYGMGEHGFSDAHDVATKLRPTNKYGYSKQLFDCWALRQRKAPPCWAGFKFFNVYGPNEYHKGKQASVALHAFRQIKGTNSLRLFKSARPDIEDGHQKRDFVYVKDAAAVMSYFLEHHQSVPSGLYNVGSGQARTFLDLGKAVFTAMGQKAAEFQWIDTPESLRAHYQYFTEAEQDKLRGVGFDREFLSLEDGIQDYVQNHLMQSDPYA